MKLIGSKAFEDSFRRLHVLSALLKPAYNEVRVGWNVSHELPNDFSALLLKYDHSLPTEKRSKLEDSMGLHPTSVFDTHPSLGDRIRRARQMQYPGVFHLEAPAAELFNNFEVLSKQVTQLHYEDDLSVPVMAGKLVPVRLEPASEPEFNPLVEPSPQARTEGGLRIKKQRR